MTWPRRILLDWLRLTTGGVALTWAGAVLVFQAVDAFENLRDYTSAGATAREILFFFALRTPEVAFQIAPAAVLLGTLLAVFRLAKNKEITAAEASGLHPAWLYVAPGLAALVIAGSQLALEWRGLPQLRRAADVYQAQHIERNPLKRPDTVRWQISGHDLWRVENLDGDGTVALEMVRRSGSRIEVLHIARAGPEGRAWRIEGISGFSYPPFATRTADAPQIPFLPEELRPIRPVSEHLGLGEAWQLARRKRTVSGEVSAIELGVHQRISWALLNLTVLVAAIPLLPRHGRKTNAAFGVMMALVVGICSWGAVVLGSALASSMRMAIGHWIPHAALVLTSIFGSTRIWGVFRMRSG
jgi:lipopolysaccharide export system permease protein